MARFRSTVLGALAAIAASSGIAWSASSAELAGTTWATEGGGAHVAFAEDAEGLVGRITWLRREQETGVPVVDEKNPDIAQQSRPLVGVTMVWGFEETRDGVWDRGRIYAPDTGKTYNAKMELDGDVMAVTGCIRWPACREQTWTRVAE